MNSSTTCDVKRQGRCNAGFKQIASNVCHGTAPGRRMACVNGRSFVLSLTGCLVDFNEWDNEFLAFMKAWFKREISLQDLNLLASIRKMYPEPRSIPSLKEVEKSFGYSLSGSSFERIEEALKWAGYPQEIVKAREENK